LAGTQTWGLDSTVTSVMSVDAMIQSANAGDLLFFRRNTIDLAHDLVSGYTHVGVTLTAPGHDALLAEMCDAEKNQRAGVYLRDLRSRVTSYAADGLVVLVRRTAPLDPAELARTVTALQHASYPPHLRWYTAVCKLVPWLFGLRDDSVMICSEFVLLCLGEPRWRCQTPADVMAWATHQEAYAPAVKIVDVLHEAAAAGHRACH
jgi:hypothetical protein